MTTDGIVTVTVTAAGEMPRGTVDAAAALVATETISTGTEIHIVAGTAP